MSLDVYLVGPECKSKCSCPTCFNEHEKTDQPEYYWSNITHNLGQMAEKAGLYKYLWRPEEVNISTAKELIPRLTNGLEELLKHPDYYKKFNPDNGWGDYDGLVKFVTDYLTACVCHPDAIVRASR
jgi:hypothetical protein